MVELKVVVVDDVPGIDGITTDGTSSENAIEVESGLL